MLLFNIIYYFVNKKNKIKPFMKQLEWWTKLWIYTLKMEIRYSSKTTIHDNVFNDSDSYDRGKSITVS